VASFWRVSATQELKPALLDDDDTPGVLDSSAMMNNTELWLKIITGFGNPKSVILICVITPELYTGRGTENRRVFECAPVGNSLVFNFLMIFVTHENDHPKASR
jgi:hypothetical protein